MSKLVEEVLAANVRYAASFGDKGKLSIFPARRMAILTCIDARLQPTRFAGLAEGDAHVVRNAGGRATDDAIRSLVISHKLLGTSEWFVIHHTNCGMELFTDEVMRELLAGSLKTATFDGKVWRNTGMGPGSTEAQFIDWLTVKEPVKSLVADVRRIREHPLVSGEITVHGYMYDVVTGKLADIPEASAAGRPR